MAGCVALFHMNVFMPGNKLGDRKQDEEDQEQAEPETPTEQPDVWSAAPPRALKVAKFLLQLAAVLQLPGELRDWGGCMITRATDKKRA